MRIGFNWWYVTTVLSLVVAGVAGYLNTHEVRGNLRRKRLYGAVVRSLGAGILTILFGGLLFAESYRGGVQLFLDFCVSDGDAAAWADIFVICGFVILTLVYGEMLIDLAKRCERIRPRVKHGHIYKCAARAYRNPDGTLTWQLSPHGLMEVMAKEFARDDENPRAAKRRILADMEERRRQERQEQARLAEQRLRNVEIDLRQYLRREREAQRQAQANPDPVESSVAVRPVVHGSTARELKAISQHQQDIIIELVPTKLGANALQPAVMQRSIKRTASAGVISLAPTAQEIEALKRLPVTQTMQTRLSETLAQCDPAQRAVLAAFFERRPELTPIATNGHYCLTLRINALGEVSVLKYSRT